MTDSTLENRYQACVLIVEDEPGFAELMASTLEDEGFACTCVSSGKQALVWLSSHTPGLILLDYTLPDMTGALFIEQLWEVGCTVPFVIVTGRDDATLAVQMMKTGAYDYLLKDTTFLDRIPAVVTRALHEAEIRERLRCAEQSLRQSEMRLSRAQQIARMGSWEWDIATGDLFLSDELYRIFDIPPRRPATADFKAFLQRVNLLDRTALRKAFFHSVTACKPFTANFRINTDKDGEIIVSCQGEAERGDDGRTRLISGTTLDITARIRAESEIQQLINYDTLTGLPNRSLLQDRLRQAIYQASRENMVVGILYLDLDRFKGINETLGHRAGDKLLQTVSQRLKACVRESDTLARLGGDEFVIILSGVQGEDGLTCAAKKILGLVAEPVVLESHEIYITASIGVTVYPMDGADSHTLLKHAELAMYKAKELDRNNFQFFSGDMNTKLLERMMLENSMRKALERDEFFLAYQPQVDVRYGRIVGMEALLRWRHPDLGLIGPDRFIYLAEETGFIVPLGEWVLQTACRQTRAWQEQGLPPVRVAVNLSARQFGQKGLDEMVAATLMESGLAAEWLELEITESAIMKDAEQSITILRKLKEMGIALAIDDFGTGYSSLSSLKRFPITHLKIDRSFVQDITTNPDDAAIAEIIIDMAQTLKLNVIAEGVETRAQMEFLSFHDCTEMQGFFFSRPVVAEEFARLLENGIKY